jgi:hypothetical protein
LIDAWISDPQFRVDLVRECRAAAWKVRNRRMAERWGFDEALRLLMETAHLMLLAGVGEVDVLAQLGCLGQGCCCGGCDLWDGQRWAQEGVRGSGNALAGCGDVQVAASQGAIVPGGCGGPGSKAE